MINILDKDTIDKIAAGEVVEIEMRNIVEIKEVFKDRFNRGCTYK